MGKIEKTFLFIFINVLLASPPFFRGLSVVRSHRASIWVDRDHYGYAHDINDPQKNGGTNPRRRRESLHDSLYFTFLNIQGLGLMRLRLRIVY
jgi:hypothetical protein